MHFDYLLKNSIEQYKLGKLCDLLIKANISIYHYENKKWWSRKNQKISLKNINEWDQLSRNWNEKRSLIKNRIDRLLRKRVSEKSQRSAGKISLKKERFSYKVLPLSLLIDMLAIENIKIYDHAEKKNKKEQKKATTKTKDIIKYIDTTLDNILSSKSYSFEEESRTF